MADFSSTSPIKEHTIADADLILEGTPKSFTMTGEGTMDGMPASVDLLLGTDVESQTDVAVTLDEAARERLGLTFGGLVTGPIKATVKSIAENRQEVALDLKTARISLPFLGWEKGKGVPATASSSWRRRTSGREVTEFRAIGERVCGARQARPSASTAASAAWSSRRSRSAPATDLSLTATAKQQGYDVRVARRGARRARHHPQHRRRFRRRGGRPIFSRSHRARSWIRSPARTRSRCPDVAGTHDGDEQGARRRVLKGAAGRTGPSSGQLGREGKTRNAAASRQNGGGALIRFTGIYSQIAGGKLILDYSGPLGGAGNGVFTSCETSA